MILLDTNVVSEAMKPNPDPAVQAWFNQQNLETLYMSSVTLAELLFGIQVLPAGKRQEMLTQALDSVLAQLGNKVLPFDGDAAREFSRLAVIARSAGRGFPRPDGYLAAIASARGFIVASRDTGPYEAAGVKVINPWL
ncbi:PIN domain-containing protein [Pseudoduganella sp. FT55W]|uniref:Ribonuclease VapC n=1 Tax=Duganella rivi TaxID=2666083 RepID=A0A7X4GNC3_9BURK|nr:type II toxin-antitoxin system VapC family toxin [Duganella rivi]MYM66705.1 PIN domain-containing protein [Duganella rivi]